MQWVVIEGLDPFIAFAALSVARVPISGRAPIVYTEENRKHVSARFARQFWPSASIVSQRPVEHLAEIGCTDKFAFNLSLRIRKMENCVLIVSLNDSETLNVQV